MGLLLLLIPRILYSQILYASEQNAATSGIWPQKSETTSIGYVTWRDVDPTFKYGDCPITCLQEWVGDDWCDYNCDVDTCGNDDGDCTEEFCAPECKKAWIGDGMCDPSCLQESCDYDGGDCEAQRFEGRKYLPNIENKDFDFSDCSDECRMKMADSICNEECDTEVCNWDGLDCYTYHCAPNCVYSFLGDNECDLDCNVEACAFDKGDCDEECAPGCTSNMLGNGFCDEACMDAECNYDMGDCGGVCKSYPYIMQNDGDNFEYAHCRDDWRGDGFCDCWCFNEECGFDFGDCDSDADRERCEAQITDWMTTIDIHRGRSNFGGDYP